MPSARQEVMSLDTDRSLTDEPVVVVGGGRHAAVVCATLQAAGVKIIGYTDPEEGDALSVPYLGTDGALEELGSEVVLAIGIGGVEPHGLRETLFDKFRDCGRSFVRVLHPSALIAGDTHIGEGVQVMAGAVVQAHAVLQDNVLINTGAIVEHHCVVGRHVHVATGAILAGGVEVGDGSFIGAGATVIHDQSIGEGALVGAGAVVVRDVTPGSWVYGVPARERRPS